MHGFVIGLVSKGGEVGRIVTSSRPAKRRRPKRASSGATDKKLSVLEALVESLAIELKQAIRRVASLDTELAKCRAALGLRDDAPIIAKRLKPMSLTKMFARLTRQERRILPQFACYPDPVTVAARIGSKPRTVHNQLAAIERKLGIVSRGAPVPAHVIGHAKIAAQPSLVRVILRACDEN